MDSGSRFKLRGSRLVDTERGLLGLVAGSGANWVEGWSLVWPGLAARPVDRDGSVQKAIEIFIVEENYDDWILSLRFQSGMFKNYYSTIGLNFDRMLR